MMMPICDRDEVGNRTDMRILKGNTYFAIALCIVRLHKKRKVCFCGMYFTDRLS